MWKVGLAALSYKGSETKFQCIKESSWGGICNVSISAELVDLYFKEFGFVEFQGRLGFWVCAWVPQYTCGTMETSRGYEYIWKKAAAMKTSVFLFNAFISKVSEWQHIFIFACCY